MKKSGQSKMKVQLYEGLLVVVIIVVIVVLVLAVRSDKKNIEKTFDNTLTYLKSQCLSYDEVVQADKIKSLVRLTEQAVEVGTDIHRNSELIDSVYLKNYTEAQRMAGIIILDEDMQPECQYSNVGLDYDAWKELIQDKKISEITKYSKKIYAERIQKNDKWYDLAAISRTDSPGVVFCYCYQDTDRLTDSYAAVNNLLAGYAMDMNGTLFIAADDKIYGTNDAQYENCQTTEIPVIQELRSTELSDNLVYFTSDGHRYCGGKGRYRVRFGSPDDFGFDEPYPIDCIKISPLLRKFADDLTHRDFLGAILNLGIERSLIGDILIRDNVGYLFCLSHISTFIMENLIKIKHTNVKCEPAAPDTDDFAPVLENLELICASARIDAVTASITKLSRSKAVELFRTQKIFVNGKCMENNSYALKPDDILVIRGTGKFIYKGCGNETRKGRVYVRLQKYV